MPSKLERQHPRGPLQAPVRYYTWNVAHDAIASEIGGGGIFIETEEPPTEGEMLTLRVQLPRGPTFTALGRVVRTARGGWARLRKPGMGIQFIDISAPDRQAVLRYLERFELKSA